MVHHEWSLPDGASAPSRRLAAALREARIASAEQTGVVVELREAEIARLDILHEMLAPLFAEVPTGIELFDPGVSGGETPRLWVDAVAHVAMGRDRRTYRFLQDTRSGRKVRAETADVREMAEAVTRYVAQRLVERERTLSGDPPEPAAEAAWRPPRRRRWRAAGLVALGMALGAVAVLAAALVAAAGLPGR